MFRLAVCALVCSTFVVSHIRKDVDRFKRNPPLVDLDSLTDEEVFALLEKSEDYAFPTDPPFDFDFTFGKVDYDEIEPTAKSETNSTSRSIELSSTAKYKLNTSPTEGSQRGNDNASLTVRGTSTSSKTEWSEEIFPSTPVPSISSHVELSSKNGNPAQPSTKRISFEKASPEKSDPTNKPTLNANEVTTLLTTLRNVTNESTTPTAITSSKFAKSSKNDSVSKSPNSTDPLINISKRTSIDSEKSKNYATASTTEFPLNLTIKEQPKTTKQTEKTTAKPKTSSAAETAEKTATKTEATTISEIETTTSSPTTTKKPTTTESNTRKTTAKKTTSKKNTTNKPTTKKPTTKNTTKKPTTTVRTVSVPPTTLKPIVSSPTSKKPSPSTSPSTPRTHVTNKPSNIEPICFNLVNPDNTTSNQCFYPQGMYPSENAKEKNKIAPTVTTTKPTSTSPPTSSTKKPQFGKPGGSPICFSLPNDPSKCFILEVNPSESPTTEKIATFAPHRVFEIVESPLAPLEKITLGPPILKQTSHRSKGDDVTLSYDRMFVIQPHEDLSTKRHRHNFRTRNDELTTPKPIRSQFRRPNVNENNMKTNFGYSHRAATTSNPRYEPAARHRRPTFSKSGEAGRFGSNSPERSSSNENYGNVRFRTHGGPSIINRPSEFSKEGSRGASEDGNGFPVDPNIPQGQFVLSPPQSRDVYSSTGERIPQSRNDQRFILVPNINSKQPGPRFILIPRQLSYDISSVNNVRSRSDLSKVPDRQPAVSNIRIKIPDQGTFSQSAFIGSHDPQRSVYERVYLDVVRETVPDDSKTGRNRRYKRATTGQTSIDETEGISLGFVVDTTASMGTELNEVKKYAIIIMNEVLNNRGSHIENFVFVPIHDEDPVHERLSLVTRNRDVMSRTIAKIRVTGGGTCPENSLIGLLKAIDLAEKDSHIFVFTDAFAQDYHLVPDVIKSIQRKKPRIYFLLTDECRRAFNDEQRYAFDRIATASTGIVVRLNKDATQLRTVLEAVEREFEKNRRIVTEAEGEPTGSRPKDIKIVVDPRLTDLSVTSTGRNTKIDVVGPRGRPRDIVKVLDMPNIQIISVPKPDPGEWTVSVTSPESPFKLVASGISTTDFLYGFSVTQTNQTSHLSKHPKQGVPNYLLLVAKDPSVLFNISSVQLVSGNSVFEEIIVTVVNEELGIYRTGPIVFPDTSFKMRINAYTNDGYPLTRLTKATIIPQQPGPPEIDCKRQMIATAGLPFNMTCSIESLIPMEIQMYKEGNPLSHPLQYSQSSTVILQFNSLEKKDGGNYVVDARNAAGSSLHYVNLVVKEEPPTLTLEPNVITAPGRRQVITCTISSFTEYSLVWMKSDSPPDNFHRYGLYDLQSNDDNLNIEGNSVIIDPVRPEDEGWYVCSARNGGGERQARAYLVIRENPVVAIDNGKNEEVIHFTKDTRVSLNCRIVKGVPSVALGWYDSYGQKIQSGTNKKFLRPDVDSLQLTLYGASRTDEGTYTCLGENLAGRDSRKVKLQFVEKPNVMARENHVELLSGDRLNLECIGTGIPEPNITWSRISAIEASPVPVMSSRKDLPEQFLELQDVTLLDSGTYICRATNDWGYQEDKISVLVGLKPHINGLAKTHSAELNQLAEIECSATGAPTPVVNWRKSDGSPVRGTVEDGVLKIENLRLEDAGVYVCSSQNKFGRAEAATVLTIKAEPPRVTCSSDTYQLVPGELADIECRVSGIPTATIRWFRNGEELDSTSGRLQFRAMDGQTGPIEIFASNEAGNDSATVKIIVLEPPSFPPDIPKTVEAVVGSNVSLPCKTLGNPSPEVTWDILNFPVIPNKLVFNPSTGSLEIFNVEIEDEGTYTCRAKNKAGQRVHTITFGVLSAPQAKLVSWDLHEGSIQERKELTLVCHTKGKPEPQVTWTKDGLLLTNSSNITLTRNKLKFITAVSSSGLYTCHAKNAAGEETQSMFVNVTAAPSIEDPEDRSISGLEGDEVVLSCVVHGNPFPEVNWYRQEEELKAFPEFIVSEGNLIIPSLSFELEGVYSCVAKNFLGVVEKTYKVTVNSVPRIKNDVPTDIQINQFSDYAIPCDATGKPNPTIQWNIGNIPYSSTLHSEKFSVHQDGTLLLYNVTIEDAGSVTCYAQNSVGLDRKIHQIHVIVPSSLTTHLQKLLTENASAVVEDVPEAGTKRLECPAPKGQAVEWFKDDKPLKIVAPERADDPHYNIKTDSRILLINDAVDTDIGKYTCVYPPGMRHDFYVNVLSKPYFYSHDGLLPPEVYHPFDGQSLIVNCSARGNPEPTVSWQLRGMTGKWIPFTNYTLKGVQFIGRRNEVLFIPEVRWAHNGTYKCTARSRLGKHSRTFSISWTGPPQVIGERRVELKIPIGKSVGLFCRIEGSPQLEFSWEFLSQGKTYHLPNPEQNLTLSNVNTESAGTYRCRASNAAGTAELSFIIKIVVPPVLSRASVTSLTYRSYEDIELKCTSRGLDQEEDVLWMKGDFLLGKSNRVSFTSAKFSSGKSYYLKIIDAREDDTDTYKCVVFNIAGKAEQLFKILVVNRP